MVFAEKLKSVGAVSGCAIEAALRDPGKTISALRLVLSRENDWAEG